MALDESSDLLHWQDVVVQEIALHSLALGAEFGPFTTQREPDTERVWLIPEDGDKQICYMSDHTPAARLVVDNLWEENGAAEDNPTG